MIQQRRQEQEQQQGQGMATTTSTQMGPAMDGGEVAQDSSNSAALEAAGLDSSQASGNDGGAAMIGEAMLEADKAVIPTRDIVYEQLAHVLAYRDASQKYMGKPLQAEDLGYMEVGRIDDPATGFQAVAFAPTPSDFLLQEGLPVPEVGVVAFRGTEEPKDAAVDFDVDGVGYGQFQANEDAIAGLMADLGSCDVTGHSLGGALAQLAACRIGGVREIVTFQAPGIDSDDVALLDEDTKSTHYRSKGCLVDNAGEEHTAGEVVNVDTAHNDNNPYTAHTDYPLADIGRERGLEVEGTGGGVEGISRSDTSQDDQRYEDSRRDAAKLKEDLFALPAAIQKAWNNVMDLPGLGQLQMDCIVDVVQLGRSLADDIAFAIENGLDPSQATVEQLVQDKLEAAGVPSSAAWIAADYLAESIMGVLDGIADANAQE